MEEHPPLWIDKDMDPMDLAGTQDKESLGAAEVHEERNA